MILGFLFKLVSGFWAFTPECVSLFEETNYMHLYVFMYIYTLMYGFAYVGIYKFMFTKLFKLT